MQEKEISRFLRVLIRMGGALKNCGAEIYRVEDTLNRIAKAYGAQEANVLVITSSIVVTLTMPENEPLTQTLRLRKGGSTDLLLLEQLNALSRKICAAPPSVQEFERRLDEVLHNRPDPHLFLLGSILGASASTVFFGGTLADAALAGCIAVLICLMQQKLAGFFMNQIEFQFVASFIGGAAVFLMCELLSMLHADKVIIGDIMLLIPGMMLTNSIGDILLGDVISGSIRLIEAVMLAASLALGIMAAIILMRGVIF